MDSLDFMNRKLKERERLARRDIETVRRLLRGKGVVARDLLMLQRAHHRLVELRTAEINETLNKPARDALKSGRTPEGLVQFEIRVPRCLYHGTTETAAANILREGIVPRSERGAAATHEDAPSHPNCVYLTDCHALGFSWDAREGGKERSAIFEVDLEPLRPNLLPDEDAVGASGPGEDPSVIEKMAKDDREFLRNVVWRSLHWHGSVAHYGTVPLSAIRRVAYIPLSVLNLVMTRWKTKIGWGALRAQQQAILAWVFDGKDKPFPVPAEELALNSTLAEALAMVPAGTQEKADRLMAAGVSADTLWRAHLMTHVDLMTREGIEVRQVTPNDK